MDIRESSLIGEEAAFDEALSANTAEYKKLRFQECRLSQVADFDCPLVRLLQMSSI